VRESWALHALRAVLLAALLAWVWLRAWSQLLLR
jgi:hypothetical protein